MAKKVVSGMVVLESQDGKRQILTGAYTLTSTPFYQKKEGIPEPVPTITELGVVVLVFF